MTALVLVEGCLESVEIDSGTFGTSVWPVSTLVTYLGLWTSAVSIGQHKVNINKEIARKKMGRSATCAEGREKRVRTEGCS